MQPEWPGYSFSHGLNSNRIVVLASVSTSLSGLIDWAKAKQTALTISEGEKLRVAAKLNETLLKSCPNGVWAFGDCSF